MPKKHLKKNDLQTEALSYAIMVIVFFVLIFTFGKIKALLKGSVKYSFIHIPKTGGTAFSYWIEQQQKINLCNEIKPYKTHVLSTIDVARLNTQPITIIRHPVDRFISSFYYWKKGSEDIKEWQRSNNWKIANAIETPDDLISILKNPQHPLYKKTKYSLTNKDQYTHIYHFTPQSRWITANTNPIIICFDSKNLSNNIQKTFDHLQVNCPIKEMPIINKSKKPKRPVQLNEESLKWLQNIYAKDFKLWQQHCE